MKKEVQVIFGSDSDMPVFLDSKFEPTLKAFDVGVRMDVASAHRHPAKVQQVCETAWREGVRIFVGIAGKAAHLTGAIASHVPTAFVIGVPLETKPFGIQDALLAMVSMPPGRVVLPVLDFYNAALTVLQVMAVHDEDIAQGLIEFLLANDKQPLLGLNVAEEREALRKRREAAAAKEKK